MRAGILTLYQADNYGAVLQAFALQKTLDGLGLHGDLLATDFFDRALRASESPLSGPAAVLEKRMKQEEAKRKALFDSFRGAYLRCSKPWAKEDLPDANSVYTVFITGSDQVWNLAVLGADESYFLPFADPQKRVSYAASFGPASLREEVVPWCRKQLRDFALLSVRETAGKDLVKSLTGRDAAVCLDPVFLLDASEWETLALKEERAPYYLLYMMQYDEELEKRAALAARKAGADLVVVTASFLPRFGFDAWSGIGVREWLGLLLSAEGVFTNSFHGTAFSLLFEKPLLVSRLRGNLEKSSRRIDELLALSGAEAAQEGELFFPSKGEIFRELSPAREASLAYLEEIVRYAKDL